MKESNQERALKVNQGIEQPPVTNPYITNFYQRHRKKELNAEQFIEGILAGDNSILSQAITLIESSRTDHRVKAQKIITMALPHCKESMRIGITGVPGAGKSTFIESFGSLMTEKGHKLAVLAIDPSSEKSKGSILGDKTRMENLANNPKAFIRPSPSGGSLGGVARKTRESVILCEAAGFDTIFIETVGVGQSETAVHSMSDLFLLLMLSGAGDELQGIKRGIMEMSDIIAITKADGSNRDRASLAKALYKNALHLFPPTGSGWSPTAVTTSAIKNEGLDELLELIYQYFQTTRDSGYFHKKREEQAKYWMYESIEEQLTERFYKSEIVKGQLAQFEKEVTEGRVSSFAAATELMERYLSEIENR